MKQMYSAVYMVNITEDCAEQEIAKIKSSKNKAPKNKNKQTTTILKTASTASK